MKSNLLISVCLVGMAVCQVAYATTWTAQVGGSALDGMTYETFNTVTGNDFITGGLTVHLNSDAQIAGLPNTSHYAAPYLSGDNNQYFGGNYNGPDSTHYLTTGIGSIVMKFSTPQNYLGLLWGSVDSYNTITFTHLDGTTTSLTGTDVMRPSAANGYQGITGTAYVNFWTTDFTSVKFTSSSYAFEFDNVAYGVPDGGTTMALMGLGFAAMGLIRRKIS